jgi:hypothetical protein
MTVCPCANTGITSAKKHHAAKKVAALLRSGRDLR